MCLSLFEVVYIYACLLICTRMSISICIHSTYVGMHVCICVCICLHACACLCVCMYMFVIVHVYTHVVISEYEGCSWGIDPL